MHEDQCKLNTANSVSADMFILSLTVAEVRLVYSLAVNKCLITHVFNYKKYFLSNS
jgi:hypothetical protein